jgi:hypothetical protein
MRGTTTTINSHNGDLGFGFETVEAPALFADCTIYLNTHNQERPAKEWREQAEGPCGNPECGNIVGSPAGGMSVGIWFAAFGEDSIERNPRTDL